MGEWSVTYACGVFAVTSLTQGADVCDAAVFVPGFVVADVAGAAAAGGNKGVWGHFGGWRIVR